MRYLTLSTEDDFVGEVVVRRSRFLAVVRRVEDEAAARRLLAEQRTTHHSARHHCSAWRLGPEPADERTNDDGEPNGTAGQPMLAVLRGAALSDVASVVTRYFGGTLLGTGGLARAYADAVTAALASASRVVRERLAALSIELPYADAARIEQRLREAGIVIVGVDHGDHTARLRLAIDDLPRLQQMLATWLSGAPAISSSGDVWIDRR